MMNAFATPQFQGQPPIGPPQNVFAMRAGMPQLPQQGMPQMPPQMPQAPMMPFQGGGNFRGPMSGAMPINPGVRPMMPAAAPQMSQAAIPQPQNYLRMRLGL